ncbi:hypothetical protein GQ54DRAFT_237369, partial [Martensiomyces pterosporus]
IEVIREPASFYQALLDGISSAKHRICLSSLYIGSEEIELVGKLDEALSRNPSLQVHILLDCLRGTRTDKSGASSASLLAPLVARHGRDRVCVSMYHTPALSGVNKRAWPQRYNETFGLQHIKIYMFDDELIMSGANLSRDYFTSRQDRYMQISNQPLAAYFERLMQSIGRFSFSLAASSKTCASGAGRGDYRLEMDRFPDPSKDPKEFIHEANGIIAQFLQDAATEHGGVDYSEEDTLAIPTVQMSQLGIAQDEAHMAEFFQITDRFAQRYGCRNFMTSAYFNFSDFHKKNVLANASRWDLLVASPEANGFFTAKGISKYIPNMYSIIEHEFLRMVRKHGRANIAVEEYSRDGWTYHGKGVWCYLDQKLPQLTMIGSPNYGYRSIYCDLEAQLTLIPGSQELRTSIHQEALGLLAHSKMVD